MLILTRKLGEGITIGDQIRVVVVEIHGNQVKLGIEAPRGIAVHREEVLARIMSENKEAATVHPDKLQGILNKGIVHSKSIKQKEGHKP